MNNKKTGRIKTFLIIFGVLSALYILHKIMNYIDHLFAITPWYIMVVITIAIIYILTKDRK